MGYSPWGHKESDTTERLTHTCARTRPHTHTHTQELEGRSEEQTQVSSLRDKGMNQERGQIPENTQNGRERVIQDGSRKNGLIQVVNIARIPDTYFYWTFAM